MQQEITKIAAVTAGMVNETLWKSDIGQLCWRNFN